VLEILSAQRRLFYGGGLRAERTGVNSRCWKSPPPSAACFTAAGPRRAHRREQPVLGSRPSQRRLFYGGG
jgi:hypothetical protein